MKNPIFLADKFVLKSFQGMCDCLSARGIPSHKIALQFTILTAVMLVVGTVIYYVVGFSTGEIPLFISTTLAATLAFLLNLLVSVITVYKMYRMAITVESGATAKADIRNTLLWENFRIFLLLWSIALLLSSYKEAHTYLDGIIHAVLRVSDVFLIICFYLQDVIFRKPTKIKQAQTKEALT